LISEPEVRLGSNGIAEIKAHPFFTGIDWRNIRTSKTPFVPEVRDLIKGKKY
jgi:hypothetical protein